MPRSIVPKTGAPLRRPINLSIESVLIDEARALDINVSRVCEDALRTHIRAEKGVRWVADNKAAFEASNAYVAEHGLPLERYRLF